jgi:hypothetical protein
MPQSKLEPKPEAKRLPGKNPSDPILLARSVIKAASGKALTPPKPKKQARKLK